MKNQLQKKMRKIRLQLKAHDISDEKKSILRKELEKLRQEQLQKTDNK